MSSSTAIEIVVTLLLIIADEFDATGAPGVVHRADGPWLADGAEAYECVREQVSLRPVPPEERGQYQALASLVLTCLGHIPMVGETRRVGDATLEVMDMDGRRIDRVLIRPDAMAPRQPGEPAARAR